MISAHWLGLREIGAAFGEFTQRMDDAMKEAVVEAASAIEKSAKARAPVRTRQAPVGHRGGTLRRGITQTAPSKKGESWSASVGPTVIYSRRIELGFKGPDALGRVYNQEANPYFVPAVDEVTPRLGEIFRKHMRGAIT